MRMPVVLAVCGSLLWAADEDVAVAVHELSYGQRVEFVLGNGEHPFADEDQRRAQLVLQVRARGKAALLGWRGLTLAATSPDGDALSLAGVQAEGTFAGARDLRDAPTAPLPGIGLPLTRQGLGRLGRLSVAVEILCAREAPAREAFDLPGAAIGADMPVPGVDGGIIAVHERAGNRVVLRLNRPAWLAVQDVVFNAADGKDLPGRNRKAEWRDEQGLLTYTIKAERIASSHLLVYRAMQARRAVLELDGMGLGMTVPGRDDLRGPAERGAGEF